MKTRSLRSVPLILLGLVGAVWVVLSLVALAGSLTGHDYLYTIPTGLLLPQLSLIGKVYLGASMLMPFIAIFAIATA